MGSLVHKEASSASRSACTEKFSVHPSLLLTCKGPAIIPLTWKEGKYRSLLPTRKVGKVKNSVTSLCSVPDSTLLLILEDSRSLTLLDWLTGKQVLVGTFASKFDYKPYNPNFKLEGILPLPEVKLGKEGKEVISRNRYLSSLLGKGVSPRLLLLFYEGFATTLQESLWGTDDFLVEFKSEAGNNKSWKFTAKYLRYDTKTDSYFPYLRTCYTKGKIHQVEALKDCLVLSGQERGVQVLNYETKEVVSHDQEYVLSFDLVLKQQKNGISLQRRSKYLEKDWEVQNFGKVKHRLTDYNCLVLFIQDTFPPFDSNDLDVFQLWLPEPGMLNTTRNQYQTYTYQLVYTSTLPPRTLTGCLVTSEVGNQRKERGRLLDNLINLPASLVDLVVGFL